VGWDLFLPTPLGLSAFVGTLVGAGAGRLLSAGIDRSNPLFVPGVAAIGSAIGVMLFAVLDAVLGQPVTFSAHLAVIVGVVSVFNAVLAYPMVRVCSWALAPQEQSSAWQGALVTGDAP
jgi:hypothetical protein